MKSKPLRRRRWLRWAAYCLGGSLGLLFVAVLLASAIVHRVWNHERVGRSISTWASATLAGRGGPDQQAFRIGRVDYQWWPALRSLFGGGAVRVEIWDVGIWDPDGGEVIYAPHVQVGLALHRLVWAQLWGRLPWRTSNLQLHLADAVIDRVRCRIEKTSNREVNLVAAFRRRPELPPGKGGMEITVNGSTIVDGDYRMAFPGWSWHLPHFTMEHEWLRYSSFATETTEEGPAFVHRAGRTTAPRGEILIGPQRLAFEDFVGAELRAEEPARQHLCFAGQAKSHGSPVRGVGCLRDVYGDKAGVDVRLEANQLRPVLATLPTHEFLRGDPSGTAHIHGPFSEVVIDGGATDVELAVAGVKVIDARGRFRFAHGELGLSNLAASVAGGRVTGKATIVPSSRKLDIEAELDGLKIDQLGRLAPLAVLAIAAAGVVRIVRLDKLQQDANASIPWKGLHVKFSVRPHEAHPHHLTVRGTY